MFPRSTRIQSIIFDRALWTITKAKAWLKRHNRKSPKPDVTKNFYRFRQEPPSHFVKTTFRTIPMGRNGIEAIIAIPLAQNPEKRVNIVIPEKMTFLGSMVEIAFDDGTIWKPRGAKLAASIGGRQLWILRTCRGSHKFTGNNKLFKKFHGWKPDNYNLSIIEPGTCKCFKYKRVKHIVYRSDKFDRKMRDYIHTFKYRTVSHSDNLKNPGFVRLSGARLKVTSRGITG
jgi:hypothetical protein